MDHTFNHDSLHAGKPVIKGEKIVLTKWVRELSFLARPKLDKTKFTIPFR